MIDIHTTGFPILIPNTESGSINKSYPIIDISLNDLVNREALMSFSGCVIIKLPSSAPITVEPIVYSICKFQQSKLVTLKTSHLMNLSNLQESIQNISNQLKSTTITSISTTNIRQSMKSLSYYHKLTTRIYFTFNKELDSNIDFSEFLVMIDYADIFIIESQASRFFHALLIHKEDTSISISTFENFFIAYDVLNPLSECVRLLDIYDTLKISSNSELSFEFYGSQQEGLDYNAFIECMGLLEIKNVSSQEYLKAFCTYSGCKETEVSSAFMKYVAFKKAWVALTDVMIELKKRKMNVEKGLLSKHRNEENLYQIVTRNEDVYMENLNRINIYIIDIKQSVRQEKDERRKKEEEVKFRLQRYNARFSADANYSKRGQIKKAQQEKSQKRIEEKVMRNQLLEKQMENKLRKQEELTESIKKNEKLRMIEIKVKGYDRLDISAQELVEIPSKYYATDSATALLSYAVILDVSKNMIELFPSADFFYWCTSVRYFNMSTNKCKYLPDEITLCTRIEIFEAYSNQLTFLPDNFGSLSCLLRLDLGSNNLTNLPSSIGSCKSLKYLSLHSNLLTTIPFSIGKCMRLEYLNLSNNKISFLPDEFEYLVLLISLHISSNLLLSLPMYIGKCNNLEYLDVSCNFLSTLPDSFGQLQNLEYCDLHNNNIALGTESLSKLSKIKYLNLYENKVSTIYKDISGCQNLVSLHLRHNCLSNISAEIGLLTRLESLDVSHNQLHSLIVEICACKSLILLNLSNNCLHGCLVPTIALLTQLSELNVSYNQLSELPINIIGCSSLTHLEADGNKIRVVPISMYSLKSLTSLSFASNLFTHFPMELSQLSSLLSLNFSENLLTLLPKEIHVFAYLQTLNLSKNQLIALPLEFIPIIEKVPNLNIGCNPWTLFPPQWGKLHCNKHCSEGAENGYELPDVLDFLYHMQIFYYLAEEHWKTHGSLYYTKRATFEDFLFTLKSKIHWADGLLEYVKYIFFKSCEYGVYPKWYLLDTVEIVENSVMQQEDKVRRQDNLVRTNDEFAKRMHRVHIAYDVDLARRGKRSEEIAAEHRVNEAIVQSSVIESLRVNIAENDVLFERERLKLAEERKNSDEEEFMRLIRMRKK